MCSKPTHTPKHGSERETLGKQSGVSAALQYTLPEFRDNEGCSYIEFYAYDPEKGRMRRKRIKTNRIKGVQKRRQYVRGVINRLTEQLRHGWNPWIAGDATDLLTFEEALERYELHIEKMLASGYFRKETYLGYKSNVKMLRLYMKKRPVYYAYQFDRRFCVDFLDYVFIGRDNGAQTRNNYLGFLRVFSGFLVEKGYLQTKPTDGIQPISKRLYQKERTCIPLDVVGKISEYCKEEDPEFLLACYLLYYCFIRPVEMTRLRVGDFNMQTGTITIPASCSKNHKTQTVTVPKKVLFHAINIGVFSAPAEDFIFSDRLKPGETEIDTKIFRDHWEKVRKALHLKKEWKFYSLKDTGITAMLKAKVAAINVRDQARHSSLAITEIYTDHNTEVNPEILDLDGAL